MTKKRVDKGIYLFQVHTGETERLRVTSDGYVGIGTTNPNAELEVEGEIRIGDSLTIKEQSETLSNPPSGYNKIFSKDDGKLYVKNSLGEETVVGSGEGEGSVTTDLAAEDRTIEAGTTLNQSFLNIPVGVTYTIEGQHVGADLTVDGYYVVEGTSIILGTAQIDQIGLASTTQTGLISHEEPLQTFAGSKAFNDTVKFVGGFDTSDSAGLATSASAGLVNPGVQDSPPTHGVTSRFKADVKGEANRDNFVINGYVSNKNLVTVTFNYRYTNSNGTAMSTTARIRITDVTSSVVLVDKGTAVSVPISYGDRVDASVSVILNAPTGTQYRIECWEQNTGGGSYTAINGFVSVTVSKVII